MSGLHHRMRRAVAGAGSGGGAPVLSFLGYIGDNAVVATSHTEVGATLGTPASNRIIIVSHSSANNDFASSVTIAGVSATKAVGVNDGGLDTSIWYASVPSGETGDITASGSGTNFSFVWYAAYTNTPAPISTGIDAVAPPAVTIDSSAGGFVVYVLSTRTDSTVDVATWSGTSVPVGDAALVYPGGRYGAAGSMIVVGGDTVSGGVLSVSALSDSFDMAAVSWQL